MLKETLMEKHRGFPEEVENGATPPFHPFTGFTTC